MVDGERWTVSVRRLMVDDLLWMVNGVCWMVDGGESKAEGACRR
mgnify:CR=1 FL=1